MKCDNCKLDCEYKNHVMSCGFCTHFTEPLHSGVCKECITGDVCKFEKRKHKHDNRKVNNG